MTFYVLIDNDKKVWRHRAVGYWFYWCDGCDFRVLIADVCRCLMPACGWVHVG